MLCLEYIKGKPWSDDKKKQVCWFGKEMERLMMSLAGSTPHSPPYVAKQPYAAPPYKHMRGWWWLMVHRAGPGEWLSGQVDPCNGSKVAGFESCTLTTCVSSHLRRKDADNRVGAHPSPGPQMLGKSLLSLSSWQLIHYKHDFQSDQVVIQACDACMFPGDFRHVGVHIISYIRQVGVRNINYRFRENQILDRLKYRTCKSNRHRWCKGMEDISCFTGAGVCMEQSLKCMFTPGYGTNGWWVPNQRI